MYVRLPPHPLPRAAIPTPRRPPRPTLPSRCSPTPSRCVAVPATAHAAASAASFVSLFRAGLVLQYFQYFSP